MSIKLGAHQFDNETIMERRMWRILVSLVLAIMCVACSQQGSIIIYDSPDRYYASPSMDIVKTTEDISNVKSRSFQIEGKGRYGVRYFWRSKNKYEETEKVDRIPNSLAGNIIMFDEDNKEVMSGIISPSDWGNGKDVLVFDSNNLEENEKYYFEVTISNLPTPESIEFGGIELDLYKLNFH